MPSIRGSYVVLFSSCSLPDQVSCYPFSLIVKYILSSMSVKTGHYWTSDNPVRGMLRLMFFLDYIRLHKKIKIMGTFNGKHFTGPVGPVIFRKRKGKQVVCAKPLPGTMKQTENTKKASGTFGMASLMVKHIKEGYSEEIMGYHDGTLHNRLMTSINPVLSQCRDLSTMSYNFGVNSFKRLNGLNFNVESPLHKYLGFDPGIMLEGNSLRVEFPSTNAKRNIKFIRNSNACHLTMSLLLFNLKDGKRLNEPLNQTVILAKKEQEQLGGQEFTFTVPDGCLCLLSIFLQYYDYDHLLNNPLMSPGAICFAQLVPGDFEGEDLNVWRGMGQKFS